LGGDAHRSIAMKSGMYGSATLVAEVTNISQTGFWLLADDEELSLPFDLFPWFRNASVQTILHVERPRPEHLSWPDLDIDLELESIRNPENYPLVSRE
jgi:hypothetical protein